jgi:GNAT superfamily N-acetyltransferase
MRIETGRVDDPGVPELFAAADAYGLSIYAPKNYHALDVGEFARDDVTLLVARAEDGAATGMVALAGATAEIKRMFVHPSARGTGLGRRLLDAVESAARARGIRSVRLETGEPQAAAIALYESAGYVRIAPFGEYVDDPTSICMEKSLGD